MSIYLYQEVFCIEKKFIVRISLLNHINKILKEFFRALKKIINILKQKYIFLSTETFV